MSSEKVLKKSAFGGFKKEGVLDYVEQLQAEILSLKKELNNTKASADENRILAEKNKRFESEIEELKNENVSLKTEKEKLISDNDALNDEVNGAKTVIADYENKIAMCESKIAEIESKFTEIEAAYNKASQTDEKANAMMLDAVNYSEKLIAKANEKANLAVSNAESAVKTALNLVSEAADRLKTVRTNYECSSAALENGVENLKGVLNELSKGLNQTDGTEAEYNG